MFNTGVLDVRNVALAIRHAATMGWRAAQHRVRLVYIPISQNRWGFARDAVFMAVARILGRPVVVHLRGANLQRFFAESSRLERVIIRKTIGWSARAIALTPALADVYAGLIPPERIRILENAIPDPWPNGIDHVQAERRARAARVPDGLQVLYVANDFATKGAATVVRALARPGLERARLRMIGAPPDAVARATVELAGDLGVGERVELLGGVEGPAKWREFAWADAFAYPTENDGQPLVVLEAMAAGLPVVASTFGGVPDTLADSGLLVEPGDDAALALALIRLVDEPELRWRLGTAARERFLAHYTPDRFQERFTELFRDLLETR